MDILKNWEALLLIESVSSESEEETPPSEAAPNLSSSSPSPSVWQPKLGEVRFPRTRGLHGLFATLKLANTTFLWHDLRRFSMIC